MTRVVTCLAQPLSRGRPRDDPEGSKGSGDTAAVMTVNDFIFECQLGSVNLIDLLNWVKETKLLHKVSGYAQTQEVGKEVPSGSRSVKGNNMTGTGSSVRAAQLSVLQVRLGMHDDDTYPHPPPQVKSMLDSHTQKRRKVRKFYAADSTPCD